MTRNTTKPQRETTRNGEMVDGEMVDGNMVRWWNKDKVLYNICEYKLSVKVHCINCSSYNFILKHNLSQLFWKNESIHTSLHLLLLKY